ncbi:TPA: J domain-containing protein [Vibrio parahaemolyticus]
MNTVTISSLTTLPTSKKKKSKLNQLWEEVEKKQRRNERYQAKLDSFHLEFKTYAEQQEQAICLATEKWIHHLMSFTQRKTIKGTQRDALYDWIQEELSILEANPFNPVNTNELRHTFNNVLMSDVTNQPATDSITEEQLNDFREEISMMLGDDVNISNEQLLEMVEDPRKFHDYLQALGMTESIEKGPSETDDEMDWGADDFFSEDNGPENARAPSNKNSQALYSDKQMTKLYRQLAKKLHPDRETDENKKIEKSALMQQLSQAKKDKDVVALLLMAQQYLPEHEMIMDNDMIKRLQATIEEKIKHLNMEYQELQHGHDLKSIIWQKFGGGNKARRENDLKHYGATLEREAIELHEKCQDIKTVKQLQVHLRERIRASHFEQQFLKMMPSELFSFEEDWF